jgi:hypothetical protein
MFQCYLTRLYLEEPKPRIAVYPYISGDAFLALADVCHLKGNWTVHVKLREFQEPSRVHFFEIDRLSLQDIENNVTDNNVIVFHNGDESLTSEIINIFRKRNCHVFATNTAREEGLIEPIPIGIENIAYRRNGSLHYYNPLNLASLSLKKKRDVLVSFSVHTNPTERNRVLRTCLENGFQNKKMKLGEFRQRLAESRFVISPPGNGIDCHRTWEAMYHKTVPVIENRYNLFQHIDLPILTVNSYYDFFKMSLDERLSLYQKFMSRGYPALYMDYWIELINKARNQI